MVGVEEEEMFSAECKQVQVYLLLAGRVGRLAKSRDPPLVTAILRQVRALRT